MEEEKLHIWLKLIALLLLIQVATASPNKYNAENSNAKSIQVFVSFSMPEQLFKEVLADSARLKIPAILNGLHNNSMQETARVIFVLTQEIPNLSLQIDPTAFEKFKIKQVPALVVAGEQYFDVIYGNFKLREGLRRIVDSGESGFSDHDLMEIIGD